MVELDQFKSILATYTEPLVEVYQNVSAPNLGLLQRYPRSSGAV